ncbi:hypothetical protein [Pedobacter nutrimenti]|uniref:hypothetical protein n=1 Tax=Pedobacter nutrimenti TaxID=1241337 RepID=UPI0029302442|nr:hypothetical protein [Pedobacter nutrimenti]
MLRKKKERVIIILFCFILVVVYALVSQISFRKKSKKEFQQFTQANIEGKLSYISYSNGIVYIKIEGDKIKYSLIPVQLDDGKYFSYFARVGDRIVKKSQSDTLMLFKDQIAYKYAIQKEK